MIYQTIAVTKRLLKQIVKDKRSIALMLVAPVLVIGLLYFVFLDSTDSIKVGIILGNKSADSTVISELKKNFIATHFTSENEAKKALEDEKIKAYINFVPTKPVLMLEGTKPAYNKQTTMKAFTAFVAQEKEKMQQEIKSKIKEFQKSLPLEQFKALQAAMANRDFSALRKIRDELATKKLPNHLPKFEFEDIPSDPAYFFDTQYRYTNADLTYFDSIAPVLMGFFIVFTVFLTGGIAFLRERTKQTLARSFATPMHETSFIGGYFFAFGILVFIQAIVLQLFVVKGLGIPNYGSFWTLLVINVLTSFTGLTTGFVLSALARNEFQLVQFIPVIIVPQLVFSGLFDLSTMPKYITDFSYIMPLHYAASGLTDVMLRGKTLTQVYPSVLGLCAFIIVLLVLTVIILHKNKKA